MFSRHRDAQAIALPTGQETALRKGQWSVRLLYFFFFAGIGAFLTFINVYYISIGLSGTQIGLINTAGPLVGIFSTVVWGMLTDRFGKPRRLVYIAVVGVILATLGLSMTQAFFGILLLASLFSLFAFPLMPLMDSTTLSLLGDQQDRYGVYRAWGTLGFMFTATLSGFVFERTGLRAIFPAYILIMFFFLIASRGLPERPVSLGRSVLHGLGKMIRQPAWLFFAATVFLIWLGNMAMITFIAVTMRAMGGADRLIGLAWTVAATIELPAMIFSANLLRRVNPARLILIAAAGYTLRLFLYSIIPAPEWVLAINILHVVSFVPFWIGAVAYANQLAPDDLKATSQGLFSSAMNLAGMVGALSSGWLFDQLGPAKMFQAAALCSFLALLLFSAGQFFTRKPRSS